MADRARALRDYKLTVEYKHLKLNAPGGVFVVPSLGDLRVWHGVVFLRRGAYSGGVFKFRIDLPAAYNDVDAWPRIFFTSRVYSPLVDAETGALDLRAQYAAWDPAQHYVVTALTFLKKIFYLKAGYAGERAPCNAAAAEAFTHDNPRFLREVAKCVGESNADAALYGAGGSGPAVPAAAPSLRFLRHDESTHDRLRSALLEGDDEDGAAFEASRADAVLRYLAQQPHRLAQHAPRSTAHANEAPPAEAPDDDAEADAAPTAAVSPTSMALPPPPPATDGVAARL